MGEDSSWGAETDWLKNDMQSYDDEYEDHSYYYDSHESISDSREYFGTALGNDDDSNVGIITGDIQLNQGASCLVVTTEILRSMLLKQSNTISEIEWVIFDEIHYMNDPERGKVWEEVIVMLPPQVNLLFLSATTPNALEFSNWIGKIRKKTTYVVTTSYRPVPLHHYVYLGESFNYDKIDDDLLKEDKQKMLCNRFIPLYKNKTFYRNCNRFINNLVDKRSKRKSGVKMATGNQNWLHLFQELKKNDMLPV